MTRLYVRIVAGMALAVVAGWAAVGLFVPQLRGLLNEGFRDQVLGNGLRFVAAEFDAAAQPEWPARLAEARRTLTIPIAIVAVEEIPPAVASRVSRDEAVLVSDGRDLPLVYMPLHAASHYLVAGPLQPPPTGPLVAMALVFAVVLTVTASAAVGIPLVRRLRSLRRAIGELGSGNLEVRLDAHAEGALSDLAESINRMASQLHEQFREREALLQAVSHEIGTPLSRMRFEVELLEEGALLPEQRQRLAALSADLDELDELSTELVGWMEADAGGPARLTFDAAPVLESLVELECQSAAGSLNVQLEVEPHLELHADQRQFQRAIENLLRNAMRYAQQRIVVGARADTGSVVVEVRDDGPGISPDQRARVLEPFVRLDVTGSRAHRGLGLGLAIVRRIVEAHGGTLTVGEAAEGGTRIATTWPGLP